MLDPAFEQATAGNGKARLCLELWQVFEGYDASAVLADASVGIGQWRSFERIAVVTRH